MSASRKLLGPCVAAIILAAALTGRAGEEEAVLLDGLSALVGGRLSDEFSASPVTHSDVIFEARMQAVIRYAGNERTRILDADAYAQARRIALLTRLLARQAMQLGEEVDSPLKEALGDAIAERMGGPQAVEEFLARLGMNRQLLDLWIERSLLAATQIEALREQVDVPSEQVVTARILADTGAASSVGLEPLRERTRRLLVEEALAGQLREWLSSVLEATQVRIVRGI